jgi:thiopurine S-methyltransferase
LIDAVYDRAALTALPENTRKLYVAHLKHIVPGVKEVFLLTIEDASENESLHEALGIATEITELYAKHFDIELIHVESIFETNPESPQQQPLRVEHKVYHLSSRSILN